MEFLWRYIGDLVGKGLEWYIIFEFIFYSIPYLIPNALPLAVLLSTIMTFGNLSERFELAALKTSGASLIRIMRPLLFVMILISALAFYSANILIPRANLSWGALFYDVTHKKPAMNVKDGIFYNELEGYSIRVGKKHDDNKTIEDVLIYAQSGMKGGIDVIIAKSGTMEFTHNERFMVLTLKDGQRYQEMVETPNYNKTYPHNVMHFDFYQMSMDLSELELKRSNPDLFKDNYNMLNIAELQIRIDSMESLADDKRVFLLNYLQAYYHFPHHDTVSYQFSPEQLSTPYADQLGKFVHLDDQNERPTEKDSANDSPQLFSPDFNEGGQLSKNDIPQLTSPTESVRNRNDLISDTKQTMRNLTRIVSSTSEDIRKLDQRKARYAIEWHKKFTLAFSCILLFFIGAPLGAIIRKGGFGTPMIAAILIFILYFILQTMGEKLAREQVIEVWSAVWLSSMIFLPFAIFLTYKASTDSKIFDLDYYRNIFRKLSRKLKRGTTN
jgi:lipopolysaccharide export system permease protein